MQRTAGYGIVQKEQNGTAARTNESRADERDTAAGRVGAQVTTGIVTARDEISSAPRAKKEGPAEGPVFGYLRRGRGLERDAGGRLGARN